MRRIEQLDQLTTRHQQLAMRHLERRDYSAAATEAHRAHQWNLQAQLLRELMLP